MIYNPKNWFWLVEGNSAEVWSSASQSFVALTDQDYLTWLGPDNTPTHISAADFPEIQMQVALAAGIQLTSTGTSSLNSGYACDDAAQTSIDEVITYILANNSFPGGNSSIAWADMSGGEHVFPDTAHFRIFATELADYVAAVKIYGVSKGTVGSIPSNQITIA